MRIKYVFTAITGACLSFLLFSCHFTEKRPYGYFRLGKVNSLLAPETEFKDAGFLLKRDAKGFYLMSTFCTYDLTPLERKKLPTGEEIYSSHYTTSTYDLNGKVLAGPAKYNLPYFELEFAAWSYGGPVETLYVKISSEVSPEWRLTYH